MLSSSCNPYYIHTLISFIERMFILSKQAVSVGISVRIYRDLIKTLLHKKRCRMLPVLTAMFNRPKCILLFWTNIAARTLSPCTHPHPLPYACHKRCQTLQCPSQWKGAQLFYFKKYVLITSCIPYITRGQRDPKSLTWLDRPKAKLIIWTNLIIWNCQ